MLDKLLELQTKIMLSAQSVEQIAVDALPLLNEISENKEGVTPEMQELLKANNAKIAQGLEELEKLKESLRNQYK